MPEHYAGCPDLLRAAIQIPEQYAHRPHLRRLACKLSDFKDPYRVFDLLLALADPVLKEVRP